MDIITQGILGSAVAQATHGKKLGKKAATWGFVIGLLPDIDTGLAVFGEWVSMNTHRTFTHSIFLETLAAIPIGLICRKWAESDESKTSWILMALGCLITHPLLDLCTSYGTEILWPFSFKRYAIDSIAIVDAFYSIPLLIVTLLGIYSKLSGSKLQKIAIGVLILTSLYLCGGYSHSKLLEKRGRDFFAQQGFNAVEVRAMPTNFNIMLYRVVGKDANNSYMCTYLTPKTKNFVSQGTIKSQKDEFTKKALSHEYGQIFLKFCQGMCCTKSEEINGEHIVTLKDMRYGFMTAPDVIMFQAKAVFDKEGNLKSFKRYRPKMPDIWNELKENFRCVLQ